MTGVLDGLKVVCMDLWWVVSSASAMMADWGADVIKVEPLTGEASRGIRVLSGSPSSVKLDGVEVMPIYQFLNRNKRNLSVDLKKESGRDILYQLIKKSDVFISNYRVAALKRLKLDYASLSQLNPRLIYAIVTGYGSKGPDKDEPTLDQVVGWARSGMQYLATETGSPLARSPAVMGDLNTAAHVTAGVMGALLHREKTGQGQELEVALLHCAFWSLVGAIQPALSGVPERREPRSKSGNPLHITYRTRDDRWLSFAMSQSDLYWPKVCQAIERPELENDPRFNNREGRSQNSEELIGILDEVFASKTIDEWDKLCRKHHLIYSPVKTLKEAIADPQALANDFFVELHHPAGPMKVLASPLKFHQNPASVRGPAPELGQHTEEILLDLGYSWEDIARLKKQEVIL